MAKFRNMKLKAFTLIEVVVVIILTSMTVFLVFHVYSIINNSGRHNMKEHENLMIMYNFYSAIKEDFNIAGKITLSDDGSVEIVKGDETTVLFPDENEPYYKKDHTKHPLNFKIENLHIEKLGTSNLVSTLEFTMTTEDFTTEVVMKKHYSNKTQTILHKYVNQ